jgi:hypothetical protein
MEPMAEQPKIVMVDKQQEDYENYMRYCFSLDILPMQMEIYNIYRDYLRISIF